MVWKIPNILFSLFFIPLPYLGYQSSVERAVGETVPLLVLSPWREMVDVRLLSLVSVLGSCLLLSVHPELFSWVNLQQLSDGTLSGSKVVHHVQRVNGRKKIDKFPMTLYRGKQFTNTEKFSSKILL